MEWVHKIYIKAEILTDCQTYCISVCFLFSKKTQYCREQWLLLVAEWAWSPVFKKKKLQVPLWRRAWQSLCEKKRRKKKGKTKQRLGVVDLTGLSRGLMEGEGPAASRRKPDHPHPGLLGRMRLGGCQLLSCSCANWPKVPTGWHTVQGQKWSKG